MLLCFFGLCILALQIGERHVQRFVPETDSTSGEVRSKFDQHKGVYRYLWVKLSRSRLVARKWDERPES